MGGWGGEARVFFRVLVWEVMIRIVLFIKVRCLERVGLEVLEFGVEELEFEMEFSIWV